MIINFMFVIISSVYLRVVFSVYDTKCDNPNTLPMTSLKNFGNFNDVERIFNRIANRVSGRGEILILGGSISRTPGLHQTFRKKMHTYNMHVINRAHGGTDTLYGSFCIKIDDIFPDIVILEYKMNDLESHPEWMESMIRKIKLLPSNPLIIILNFYHTRKPLQCAENHRYVIHSMHYGLPLIDLCRQLTHCYHDESTYHLYSKKDGYHPDGPKGHVIPGTALNSWFDTMYTLVKSVSHTHTSINNQTHASLPPRVYRDSFSNQEDQRYCQSLNDDAPSPLLPIAGRGFRNISRIKTREDRDGFQGYQPLNSIKRCWEGNMVDDFISFEFNGTNLMVAVYQHVSKMGVAEVYLDNELIPRTNISGYPDLHNWPASGKQDLVVLFKDLPNSLHKVTFKITSQPANPLDPGHNFQIIALLYTSPR